MTHTLILAVVAIVAAAMWRKSPRMKRGDWFVLAFLLAILAHMAWTHLGG